MTTRRLTSGMFVVPNIRVALSPRWTFKEVSQGTSYAGLASALGDTIVFGPHGAIEGSNHRVPDARLSMHAAMMILSAPEWVGAPEARAKGAVFPDGATHAYLSRTAMVAVHHSTDVRRSYRLVMGNDMELVVAHERVSGWILRRPLEHLVLPGALGQAAHPRAQAAVYEMFQLIDEEVDVAISERAVGFFDMLREAHALADGAPAEQRDAVSALSETLFGPCPT
jgi:hypothetical protein